jgi:hypothetical protein
MVFGMEINMTDKTHPEALCAQHPAPKSHDSEDDFDAAIDAAIEAARAAKAGEES